MAKYRHSKGLSPLQIFLIVAISLVSLSIIGGGAFAVQHFVLAKEEPTNPPTVATTAPTVAPATVDEPATEAVDTDTQYTELAKKHLENMSLDEKIYQMLMVTPESLTGVDVATAAGDATKEAITKYPVGGVFYRADNFEDETQTTDMIKNSQSYAKTAMFIAVSEDGGETAPVYSKLNTTKVDYAFTEDGAQKTFENASTIAKDIKKFGFNFNFSPSANVVADVKPETTGDNITQVIKAFQSEFVISAPKYFPVTADSEKTLDELKTSEFVPFVSAIKDGADVITLSSNKLTKIEDAPVFLSKKVVTDTLINELKFDGVIVTPNLSDSALTGAYDSTALATGSIKAGADILFCPSNIDEYFTAIKSACDSGDIKEERINESVTKILALKYKNGILIESTPEISNTQTAETTNSTTVATTASTTTSTEAPTTAQ